MQRASDLEGNLFKLKVALSQSTERKKKPIGIIAMIGGANLPRT